jgi:hypothetical protein
MNWLERARREIHGSAGQPTANTAEGNPTAVTAVLASASAVKPPPSIGSNGSAETLREAFEERAAIMEYDGRMTREDAERAAWALVSKHLMH